MKEIEIKKYLLQQFPKEDESCDWKNYSNLKNTLCGHKGDDVMSYISGISNMNGGALVIGVKDGTLDITGIQNFGNYNTESAKAKIVEKCKNLPFEGLDIIELKAEDTGAIVWIITIPKHNPKLPVYAHNQAWQRSGDTLIEILEDRLKSILSEIEIPNDWSATIVEDATLSDLDPEAIEKAKKEFVKRNPHKKEEIQTWTDQKFLDKAKLTIKGHITYTALILLGKDESEHFLSPFVAKIRWSLRSSNSNQNKDYDIFSMPLLLSVDKLYSKIRNVKYRLIRPDSLFPDEMLRYDIFNIREPLHNAIAHQDYTKCSRIEIVEYEDDHLVFQNAGNFLPKSVEDVIIDDCPESVYRNRFLVEAMRNLNMIDSEGGGIKKMFIKQKDRFFPLPEFDLNDGKVKVSIVGQVIDENFAKILSSNPTLSLSDIMLLDKVQKHQPINGEQAKYLRKLGYIEGRKPNYYLAHHVVETLNDASLKSQYIKNKSFDDDYFKKMIIDYLRKFNTASRKEIDNLLREKLSDVLTEEQKTNKIGNLLKKLRMKNIIVVTQNKHWRLV